MMGDDGEIVYSHTWRDPDKTRCELEAVSAFAVNLLGVPMVYLNGAGSIEQCLPETIAFLRRTGFLADSNDMPAWERGPRLVREAVDIIPPAGTSSIRLVNPDATPYPTAVRSLSMPYEGESRIERKKDELRRRYERRHGTPPEQHVREETERFLWKLARHFAGRSLVEADQAMEPMLPGLDLLNEGRSTSIRQVYIEMARRGMISDFREREMSGDQQERRV